MASKPTLPTPANQRHRFTVELTTRDGMTPAESLEWVQKFFSYYHPGLDAKVIGKAEVLGDAPTIEGFIASHGADLVKTARDETLFGGEPKPEGYGVEVLVYPETGPTPIEEDLL